MPSNAGKRLGGKYGWRGKLATKKRAGSRSKKQVEARTRLSASTIGNTARAVGTKITILPNRMYRTVKYGDVYDINPSAGVTGVQVFRANGLYDPDATATGHQPRGHDEYAAMYNHFRVLRSRIVAKKVGDGTYVTHLAIHSASQADGASALKDILEWPQTSWVGPVAYSGGNAAVCIQDFDSVRDLGKAATYSASCQGVCSSSDPTEAWYFNLHVAPGNNAGDPGSQSITVSIEYDVVYEDPKSLASS